MSTDPEFYTKSKAATPRSLYEQVNYEIPDGALNLNLYQNFIEELFNDIWEGKCTPDEGLGLIEAFRRELWDFPGQ